MARVPLGVVDLPVVLSWSFTSLCIRILVHTNTSISLALIHGFSSVSSLSPFYKFVYLARPGSIEIVRLEICIDLIREVKEQHPGVFANRPSVTFLQQKFLP